ncbi:MAG: phosphoribosyl-AMP cyclohydrolase [Gammaproteobacteria bacterium]|nr:phosphoribosyl-AMP cyclohydrolase [Gammaproteobacteria bacterium]NIR82741.1 phosphoribosyl-AMP cyclohydrolase [Gammaproteobacteria bacterium]NIR89605.1 phosphoribosyl-AMP cyclohydrolase [Gammaproteobacteria bacterium]NIU03901.1 phosphoribosyl-AMP cyclohydrolase [Gammaproteobacteria bacterium]NIV51217.1 phosphoribosyl-AMP cyclohydrolase [Gammaproteobacteria bacterium]
MGENWGENWLDRIRWSEEGLVPVIAQDVASGDVLMLAWMNREALERTVREGRAVYWSRSRARLWQKGEDSGHDQLVRDVELDCDNDAVLLRVEQRGGIACHTGRRRCFHQRLQTGRWVIAEPVLREPDEIYGKGRSPRDG